MYETEEEVRIKAPFQMAVQSTKSNNVDQSVVIKLNKLQQRSPDTSSDNLISIKINPITDFESSRNDLSDDEVKEYPAYDDDSHV